MEDDVILSLSTGREKELDFVLEIIERNVNVKRGTPLQHILLIGPRGSGKSFFLRLVEVHLKNKGLSEFVLLPEEQLNIYQPAELIRQIKNKFMGKDEINNIAGWSSNDIGKEWESEIVELEKALSEKHCSHIVAAVENFDLLLKKEGAFKDNRAAGLLRKFLTEKSWITLIATSLYPDIESNYDYPIFHFFARHELNNWNESDHLSYLGKISKKTVDGDFNDFSKAKIRALTRFTGGSPRITVIMADILAKNRLDSAAKTLEHTIDELTPFYQDLINRMPNKSKLLFDALIRGGEPCTQSELAQRVGTTQNIISQHFNKLQIGGYLFAETVPGKKYKLYSVRDRLFAHFYKMRYILHGSEKSILAVMSEFLTQLYINSELKSRAIELYESINDIEGQALDMGRMGLNLMKLGNHKKALESHQRALDLYKEIGNVDQQAWNLGQMAVNELLMGKDKNAWKIIDSQYDHFGDERYGMVKQLGKAVAFYCQNHEIAKAYSVGRKILSGLLKRKDIFESARIVQEFFIDLLSEKADLSVIGDLVDEALKLFGENMKLQLETITGTLEYLKSQKDKRTLMVMIPEKRKAVEAVLEELGFK
jgi:tetratricopeptide (TPR) repeat protein